MSLHFFSTGGTDYSNAFTRAFELLKGSSAGVDLSRRKVIIFLTDGKPNDAPKLIMETIKTKNAELNNSVVIMTYGMLQNLQILQDIAEQDGTGYGVSKAPDVTVSTLKEKFTPEWPFIFFTPIKSFYKNMLFTKISASNEC